MIRHVTRASPSLHRALDRVAGAAVHSSCHATFPERSSQQQEGRGEQPGSPPPQTPPQQHWLDKHLPGARQWLETKNRTWWIKGVLARCQQYPELEGRQQLLQAGIAAEYGVLHDRYAHWVVDERSETHLQVACLALATRKVVLPLLRDEQEVLNIISEHMGSRTSPVLSFLMRAVKFLHKDPFVTLSSRLRGLQWDYGRGFQADLLQGQEEASLTVSSCFYHSLYSQEGAPQLSMCSCCSQDEIWLAAAQYKGVAAGLESSIARGDTHCCFRVRRVPAGQGT